MLVAPHQLTDITVLIRSSYTPEQMNSITVAHRDARNLSDKVAKSVAKTLRSGLDLVSGYRHEKAVALHAKDPAAAVQKYGMTEKKYLIRNVFLESIAGVPGSVAGILRHLSSVRRMKRDNGYEIKPFHLLFLAD